MIWSTTGRIFFHSGPFFTILPYNDQENKNFEKMKKTLEDIIILHMMYEIWSVMDKIFVIGPFLPHDQKNQILKK